MPHQNPIGASLESALRVPLKNWAARFTPIEELQDRLVEQTIAVACDDLAFMDSQPIEEALFRILRRLVLLELSATCARKQVPAAPPLCFAREP